MGPGLRFVMSADVGCDCDVATPAEICATTHHATATAPQTASAGWTSTQSCCEGSQETTQAGWIWLADEA